MRKVRDSGIEWIGKIPNGWKLDRLKYHATLNPSVDTSSFKDEDEVSFVPMENLKNGYHCTSNVSYSKVKKGYTQFNTGDILIAKVTPCFENGNIAIASDLIKGTGFGSTEINVIRCRDMTVKYLFYYLQNPKFIERGISDMFGVAGLKRLIPGYIIDSFYPVPTAEEQQAIADYLDRKCERVDSVIASKEKTNTLLKEQRQSLIFESVTKGLDPTAHMKDSGVDWIGEIPKLWDIRRMKHLASEPLQYGANEVGIDYTEELPRYIRITDISLNNTLKDIGKQSLPNEKAANYLLDESDILFARSGATAGKSFYYKADMGKACFAGYLIRFKPNLKITLSKFLYYYTLTSAYSEWANQIFIQATIQNISADKYNNLNFALPPTLGEQREIVAFLDRKCAEIDSVIAANNTTIEKLKEYRQSIIYEAVTGKMEVR